MNHLSKALSEPNRLLKFTGASLDPRVIANIPLSDELIAEAFEVKQKNMEIPFHTHLKSFFQLHFYAEMFAITVLLQKLQKK